jgi:carboxymethylenebutenolidase
MTTIDRSRFMGGSAAMIAAVGAVPADAQTADYGKPHPPIVPENDPALTIQHGTLKRPDATISAYIAMPKSIKATTPGIVMSAHIWGVDAQYRDMARRFAKLGYIVIAPGIFDRLNPPNGDGMSDSTTLLPILQGATAAGTVTGDLLAGHDWIRQQATRGKIGLYGNCGGGGLALQALSGNTNYAAAAILYGYVRGDLKSTDPPPPEAFAWAARVTTPVIGFYGGADGSIKAADIQTAYGMFKGPHDVTIYPDAPHAFLDDTRNRYRPDPATDAWAKMIAWYGKYLTTP